MRVLYVAPRFHTNQTAIMKGWIEHGAEVCFLSQYAGKLEDYSEVKPVVIGYSTIFNLFYYLYVHVFKRKHEYAVNMRLKYGFPPVWKLLHAMNNFSPDVVITRERSIYSVCVTLLCRLKGWPVILYNQSPVMEEHKSDISHRIMYYLTPKYRITPVNKLGNEYEYTDTQTYFLPFLMEPHISPDKKEYFVNNRINLFCIGKYQKRKNHHMMIEVVEKLAVKYPVHLFIAGEVSDSFQENYYKKILDYVKKHKLEKTVEVFRDLSREQVFDIYKETDLFVLPSSEEPAAVSPLEAMSFSIPVISGDDNGTACYIEEGRNGYIFADKNADDLYNKIELIICKKGNLLEMGKESYKMVMEKHQFEIYYQTILEIVRKLRKRD